MVLNVSGKGKEAVSESNGKSVSPVSDGANGASGPEAQQSAGSQVRAPRKQRSDKGIPRKRRTDSSAGTAGRTPAPIRPTPPTAKPGKKPPTTPAKSVETAVKKSFFSIFKL